MALRQTLCKFQLPFHCRAALHFRRGSFVSSTTQALEASGSSVGCRPTLESVHKRQFLPKQVLGSFTG